MDANASEVSEMEVSGKILKKRKVDKSEDESVPLPNPFTIPKHFRSNVETALRPKKMTKETQIFVCRHCICNASFHEIAELR